MSGACFYVHKGNGKTVKFQEHAAGLHYYDAGKKLSKVNNNNVALPVNAVKTVAGNKKNFSSRQIKDAEHARRVYSMVGRPSTADYKGLIAGKLLPDCPVRIDDVVNADKIFGPDVAALKGKTTRPKAPVVRQDIIAIPPIIRERHSNIDLVADLMFVNRIPFLVTLS